MAVNTFFRALKITEDSSPPIHKMMDRNAGSAASLGTAARWLRNCTKNHESCRPSLKDRRPPKRLLDVGSETQDPKLVEIVSASRDIEWAALSYCWGGEPSWKLTTKSISKLKYGLAIDILDATIRDAILATRALGLSYIWIDALCVNQEKGAKEWEEEAGRMNDIYGGSIVTLVAANSRSTMDGFLHERDVQYIRIPLGQRHSTKLFLSSGWISDYDEVRSPWGGRGWTMQEGLLPNRILYYTPSQMVWRCCEERRTERGTTESLQAEANEAMKYGDDISFESGWLWRQDPFTQFKQFPMLVASDSKYISGFSREPFRLWYNLIEDHSQRQFTDESDRLIAISGLARMFGEAIKDDGYVAGLWKSDLIRGLLWDVEDSRLVLSTTAHDTLPSWSWASAGKQLISHANIKNDQYAAVSQIENVHVDLVDPLEPFGSVTSGKITITGPLKRFPRLYDERWELPEAPLSQLERHLSKLVSESLSHEKPSYMAPSGGHFAALQVASCGLTLHLLLLETAGGINDGTTSYRRVGTCTFELFDEASAASPELEKLLDEFPNTLAGRLGPPQMPPDCRYLGDEVYKELQTQPWKKETVLLV